MEIKFLEKEKRSFFRQKCFFLWHSNIFSEMKKMLKYKFFFCQEPFSYFSFIFPSTQKKKCIKYASGMKTEDAWKKKILFNPIKSYVTFLRSQRAIFRNEWWEFLIHWTTTSLMKTNNFYYNQPMPLQPSPSKYTLS